MRETVNRGSQTMSRPSPITQHLVCHLLKDPLRKDSHDDSQQLPQRHLKVSKRRREREKITLT